MEVEEPLAADFERIFQTEIESQLELVEKIEASFKQARLIDEDVHLKRHSNLLEMLLDSLTKLKDNKTFQLNFQTNQIFCKIILKSFLSLLHSDLKYNIRKKAFILFGSVNENLFLTKNESDILSLLEKEFQVFLPCILPKIIEMFSPDEDSLKFIDTVFNLNMYINVNSKIIWKNIDVKVATFYLESIEFLQKYITINPKKFLLAINSPIFMLSYFHSLRRSEEIMTRFSNLTFQGICLLEQFTSDSLELRKCLPCILINFSQFLSKQGATELSHLLQNKLFYKLLKLIQEELDNGMQDAEYLDFCFRNLEYFIIDFDTFTFDKAYKDLMTFCVSILRTFNENSLNILKSEVLYKLISEVLLIVFKMLEYRKVDFDNFLEQDWMHVIEPVWRWIFLYTDHNNFKPGLVLHLIRCLNPANHSNQIDYFVKAFEEFMLLDLQRGCTYFDDKNTSLCFYEVLKIMSQKSLKRKYTNQASYLLDLYMKIQTKQSFPKWCENFIYFYAMLFHLDNKILESLRESQIMENHLTRFLENLPKLFFLNKNDLKSLKNFDYFLETIYKIVIYLYKKNNHEILKFEKIKLLEILNHLLSCDVIGEFFQKDFNKMHKILVNL